LILAGLIRSLNLKEEVAEMKRYILPAVAVTVIVALTAGCASRSSLRERDAEIASLKEQLENVQNNLSDADDAMRAAEERNRSLQAELNELSEKARLDLEAKEKYTILRVPDRLLFGFSSARISESGITLLDDIAGIFGRYPEYDVRIEGHTDNIKIKPEFYDKFRSNWELSTARATAVVRHLAYRHNIDPERLVAVGYGEYRPVATNDTSEGRNQNRRVEFYIVPTLPAKNVGQ
jgi:chemotaxis protein MotB